MSYIIGLSSLRPTGVDMVYVQVSELEIETLCSLDRALRRVILKNPRAEWTQLLAGLESDGFSAILHPRDNPVFMHSRPWDEHLVGYGESFFVSFPSDAPYELAGQMLLATPYPMLYASISADYSSANQLVLINKDHDPVYADDLAWSDDGHTSKVSLGAVRLPREQFVGEHEYALAKQLLESSGYQVAASDDL